MLLSLHPETLIDSIRHRLLQEFNRQPPQTNRITTLTLSLSELPRRLLSQVKHRWFYWAKPDQGIVRLGIGEALRIGLKGENRFRELSNHFKQITSHWDRFDPDKTAIPPILFTGFAFSPEEIITSTFAFISILLFFNV